MTALFTTCSPAARLRVLPPRSGGAQRIFPIALGSRSTEPMPSIICITCIRTTRHNHNCRNSLTSNISVQKNSLHMHKPLFAFNGLGSVPTAQDLLTPAIAAEAPHPLRACSRTRMERSSRLPPLRNPHSAFRTGPPLAYSRRTPNGPVKINGARPPEATMRGGPLCSLILALLWATATASAAEPPKHTNRLSKETSPYLLQHAHNPVDWFPWGPEALEKAKKDGKLIFLSIGYSSCHWCHVMERESFEDAEIAKFLNEHFVCIKVDREERPDIDAIYMTALQVYNQLAGSGRGGGWPLSMFLTPQGEPFVGGTYFPARDGDREGAAGFLQLTQKVHEVWSKEPDRIRGDAATVVKFTREQMEKRRGSLSVPLDDALPAATLAALAEEYDPKYGGFGYSPDG